MENPDEMAAALARLDRFNLARTPNFEPRRAAGDSRLCRGRRGGRCCSCRSRSGPEARCRTGWRGLARRVDRRFRAKIPAPVETQAPRPPQLYRAAPPACCAPMRRFCGQIVSGKLAGPAPHPDQRPTSADLPAAGRALCDVDADTRRLSGLPATTAGCNLAGRPALRVDRSIGPARPPSCRALPASRPADLVLREDRLAEGLAFLAAEAGHRRARRIARRDRAADRRPGRDLRCRHWKTAAPTPMPRDYMGFGFCATWQPPSVDMDRLRPPAVPALRSGSRAAWPGPCWPAASPPPPGRASCG